MNIPFSRRSALASSALGIGQLALADLLHAESPGTSASALAPRQPHFIPKAKRVVHFFLNGGPSHVDTFDPKPALTRFSNRTVSDNLLTERKTGAAFPSPFRFRPRGQSGIE
ncbi:MAG: DUF1501 domain-containing protein, partial [Planctomycetaceae bacterium]